MVSTKIRVGLVGLNAPFAGAATGTSWASSAHLPYLQSSSKYEIVALQNSSKERAEKAIEAYKLDSEKVKAYGTPEEIANDPNVDLVVVSIRVDRHASALIPAIKAGKAVFVEWPIEANYAIAKELTDLVKLHDVRNVVGLQGRWAPVARKIQELIGTGEIGDLESSTIVAKNRSGPTIPSQIDYFTDKKVGGNQFTIGLGHSMEFLLEALGPLKIEHSLLINRHPRTVIVDPKTNAAIRTAPNDVPTQIAFTATTPNSAVLTYKFHNHAVVTPDHAPPAASPNSDPNSPTKSTDPFALPALDWRIFGTKGEIRLVADSWSISVGAENWRLQLLKADEGVLREVEFGWEEGVKDLPRPARNIAGIYEAFAEDWDDGEKSGEEKKKAWYPDFEYALGRHEMLDEMYKKNGF